MKPATPNIRSPRRPSWDWIISMPLGGRSEPSVAVTSLSPRGARTYDRERMLEEGFFIEGGRYVRNDQATTEDYESRRRFLNSFGSGDDEAPSGAEALRERAEDDGDL